MVPNHNETEISKLIEKIFEIEDWKKIITTFDLCNLPHTELFIKPLFQFSEDLILRQFMIDLALKRIAISLVEKKKGLFDRQTAKREEIKKTLKQEGSVPRNLLRQLLEEEKAFDKEIREKKETYQEIIQFAKHIDGLEVFDRGEAQYNLYYCLEVDYAEIVRDQNSSTTVFHNDIIPMRLH